MTARLSRYFLLVVLGSVLYSQEEGSYRLRVLARIEPTAQSEASAEEVWEEGSERVLGDGVPLRFRLERPNLSIQVRITPYVHGERFLMIVQVDARRRSGEGRYVGVMNTVQTIPMELDTPVVFYPFGKASGGRTLALELNVSRP